jgi:ferritin-like metal-binding protein YciE
MQLKSLEELFVRECQQLYSCEQQITEALPKMIRKASSRQLKSSFELHLRQTEDHIKRLDKIFDDLEDYDPEESPYKGMEGVIREGQEILKAKEDPETLDAALIAVAQKLEHFEIAGYGTARTYAELLGRKYWVRLLQETLNEEKETDQKLSELAESIDVEARAA